MARIRATIRQDSGIPLGGLGTGSIEIRPDGYFHEWQIFNLDNKWACWLPDKCRDRDPQPGPRALSFFVRTEDAASGPQMRRLGLRSDQHDLYSYPLARSVEAIVFDGRFPVADLAYEDAELPVAVSARMFSPFTPHDARTSGTPGFYTVFGLRNPTARPVKVSLMAQLANPVALTAARRRLVNRLSREGDTTFLTLESKATGDCMAGIGSLGLSMTGGRASWVLGDFHAYMRGTHVSLEPDALPHLGLLPDFLERGGLTSLRGGGRSPAGQLRLSDEEIRALSADRRRKLVRGLRKYASFDGLWRLMARAEPGLMKTARGEETYLRNARACLNAWEGKDRSRQTWGAAALASSLELQPGAEREIVFTLGWYFPHHYDVQGTVMGHQYQHWFDGAEAVNRFLAANLDRHRRQTCAFADTLYDTSLPVELADAWSGQLSTLVKSTWWTADGDFGVWEGLGCCGFHTTDITYQGSFNILALFPELQQHQMKMGARFQREDGRVHHFFRPNLKTVDQGFDRVDMNQQFVMLICRDYLWTGDKRYLRSLWPNILKAMRNTAQLDRDGDGLPDSDTRRNTYDNWNFRGTPSYIASLWLSALLAGIRLAEELGEKRQAAAWRRMLRRGAAGFERKLWNGEYYSLWVDGDLRDECCMTDQLSGEGFTQLVGLGHVLPRERVTAALHAVMRHNFLPQQGLVNANYPPGATPRLSTWQNHQQRAPWTGIEYITAAAMIEFGLTGEALDVVRNIHRRYLRAGQFWNHVECGDHYYRAMSSWALLLAATGFKIDVPRGRAVFAPAFEQAAFRAPWVSSTGWGKFRREAGRFELVCLGGRLRFRELELALAGAGVTAERNGRRLRASGRRSGERLVLAFGAGGVELRAGDSLTVTA